MFTRTLFITPFYIIFFIKDVQGRPVETLMEKRQDKVMIQKWDISCGAAALGTILKYHYGEDVREQDIARAMMQRDEYLKNPDLIKLRLGFSLMDLKRYVDRMGYEGVGLGKMSFDDLIARAPVIVPVYINGYNHFVVFRGFLENRVLIADPAWGNRTLTMDQFMDLWVDNPGMGKIGFQVVRKEGDENLRDGVGLAPFRNEFVNLN